MLIFWHIIASFFFVLGVFEFVFELRRALCRDKEDGLWLTVFIDSDNENYAEKLLRRASEFSSEFPVMVCCRDISPETALICEKICTEEGFESVEKEDT